jgi:hypothetical protein
MKFYRAVRNHHLNKYDKSVRKAGRVYALKLTFISKDGWYKIQSRKVNTKIGTIYIYIYVCKLRQI